MAEKLVVEPDLGFIKEMAGLGGDTLKKCFQCATCSVVCPIAPETQPFPRKEMIAASWGLKDKLVGDMDIWLCHNCGDCTTMCPRGAKPGEVLGAIRSYAIQDYAAPKAVGKMVNNPKMLPILFLIPSILFLIVGFAYKAAGINWLNFSPGGEIIAHYKFFNTWLVDSIFVPTMLGMNLILAYGVYRFICDIHKNALAAGKVEDKPFDPKDLVTSLINVVVRIMRHDKFSECGENKERATAHMMVLFGFIGLFVVTGTVFIGLYVFGVHGPLSQINPLKWIGNIGGLMLIIGSLLMVKNRLTKTDQTSSYQDWYLIGMVFMLGFSGMLTQMTRLAGGEGVTYVVYFIHLQLVWMFIAFLPYTKIAHLVYRTAAMVYADYMGRGFK